MSMSTRVFCRLGLGALAAAAVLSAQAAESPGDPRAEIIKKMPGTKLEEIKPSPVPGLFELTRGGDIGYVTSDGKYFLGGDLYDMETRVNLTDQRRNETRVKLLAGIPESEMLIFSPANVKYTVTVFTDVDCGYCRKLHSEIKELNRLGVRVRYLFYPRSGPGSASWKTAEAVWCSADRNAALTRAKLGEEIKAKNCGATPVAREYELGQELGLRGTPGIFMSNGHYVPGYMPAAKLVEELKSQGT